MDYVDDSCMVMFSTWQVERMHAALDAARPSFSAETQPLPAPATGWLHMDLTVAGGAPDAAGDPVLASWSDGKIRVLYLGVDHHIHALRLSEDSANSPL
jgi:hypothetical protein